MVSVPKSSNTGKRTKAIATFTKGPAMATQNSCTGFLGKRSKRATPPMGYKVISLVCTSNLLAIKAWPNSCKTTHKNKMSTNKLADTAPQIPQLSLKAR